MSKYFILNWFLDVPIPKTSTIDSLRATSYIIFPFKTNNAVITKYDRNGICFGINLYDYKTNKIKKFNTHMTIFEGVEDINKIPSKVIDYCREQIEEVKSNKYKDYKLWKNWVDLDSDGNDVFEYDNLSMSNFRYICNGYILNYDTSTGTITTKQDRLPNGGIIKCKERR